MLKSLRFVLVSSVILMSLPSLCFAQSDSVIATIWLPDNLGGVSCPRAFTYNSINNKIYVCGDERVVVIDGATNERIAGSTVGKGAYALAYNPTNNKIYCANWNSDNVTIIDGASNSVITTVGVGHHPLVLAYNSINNKLYCANSYGSSISVIACSTPTAFDSITVSNEEGVILSIDSTDWCYGGGYAIGDTIPDVAGCDGVPFAFRVFPPYPNPSTDSTTVYYWLPEQSHVSFVLYNQDGDSTLMISEYEEVGCHSIVMDLSELALGLYRARFKADGFECYGDIWVGTTDVPETPVDEILSDFHLFQNYPNPFNPETRIQFKVQSLKLRELVPTSLRIYNILGQRVKTLVNEEKKAGTYEVIWDGKDDQGKGVSSGIYFYQLRAGDFTETKKMLLLK